MAYMNSSHKADGTPVQVDLGRGTVLKGSVAKMPFCPNGYCRQKQRALNPSVHLTLLAGSTACRLNAIYKCYAVRDNFVLCSRGCMLLQAVKLQLVCATSRHRSRLLPRIKSISWRIRHRTVIFDILRKLSPTCRAATCCVRASCLHALLACKSSLLLSLMPQPPTPLITRLHPSKSDMPRSHSELCVTPPPPAAMATSPPPQFPSERR